MKKWTKSEMASHGFSVYYYGGLHVDLRVPKGLDTDAHYEYLDQKMAYMNSLGRCKRTPKRKKARK